MARHTSFFLAAGLVLALAVTATFACGEWKKSTPSAPVPSSAILAAWSTYKNQTPPYVLLAPFDGGHGKRTQAEADEGCPGLSGHCSATGPGLALTSLARRLQPCRPPCPAPPAPR